MAVEEFTIPVTFRIGTIKELGLGGLKTDWITAEHNGAELSLCTGAGLGSQLLEASCRLPSSSLYAQASILPLAQTLFTELERRAREQEEVTP